MATALDLKRRYWVSYRREQDASGRLAELEEQFVVQLGVVASEVAKVNVELRVTTWTLELRCHSNGIARRPDLAQGGGNDPSQISAAIEKFKALIQAGA